MASKKKMQRIEEQQQEQQKTVDVVIVGAGIAGLAAADQLRSNGVTDVVILEASNRFVFVNHTIPIANYQSAMDLSQELQIVRRSTNSIVVNNRYLSSRHIFDTSRTPF